MVTKRTADIDLFHKAIAGTTPLRPTDRAVVARPKARPKKRIAAANTETQQSINLADLIDEDAGNNASSAHFMRPGQRHHSIRDLRRGRWPVEAELDLHGNTRDEAREKIVEFLNECMRSNRRILRIIHGRGLNSPDGTGILKSLLPGWLKQCDEVLAFCPAGSRDGGSGALLVRLKNPKK